MSSFRLLNSFFFCSFSPVQWKINKRTWEDEPKIEYGKDVGGQPPNERKDINLNGLEL